MKRSITLIIFILILTCLHSQNISPSHNYVRTKTFITSDKSRYTDHIIYYDGMGHVDETIDRGVTPSGKDLVYMQQYDQFYRPSKVWLPEGSNGGGAWIDTTAIKIAAIQLWNDNTPYSYNVYEASPLSTVVEQYGAGESWHNNGKRIVNTYLSTTESYKCHYIIVDKAGKAVKLGEMTNTSLISSKDEDGNESLRFKDVGDRNILDRKITKGISYDTYYVYDDAGFIRYVYPPSTEISMDNGTIEDSSTAVKQYAYIYRYDGYHNCIYKKMPGCEPTYMIYDKAGRCIFTQDGNLRSAGKWEFTIPDIWGRTVLSGTCTNSLDYTAEPMEQTVVSATWLNTDTPLGGYTVTGVSLNSPTMLSAAYYDNYEYIGKNGIPNSLSYTVTNGYGQRYTGSYKGLQTGCINAILSAPDIDGYLYKSMYYDNRRRVVQTNETNTLGGTEREDILYDFTGSPLSRQHIHTASGKPTQTEQYTYEYDTYANRLIKTKYRLNGGTEIIQSENTYDDIGRLSSVNNGAGYTQTYSYNLRNWVTAINGSKYRENLYYNTGLGTPCYNGNISSMTWAQGDISTQRGYKFIYDNVNRLTDASYGEGANIDTNVGRHDMLMTYDKMGNTLTMKRAGRLDNNAYGLVDDLTYTYNGNQLKTINDAVEGPYYQGAFHFRDGANSGIEYEYDANGNVIKDLNKGISKIEYNLLNLPEQITHTNGNMETYKYETDGTKLSVTYKIKPETVTAPMTSVMRTTATQENGYEIHTTAHCGNVIYNDGECKILTDNGYIKFDSQNNPQYYYYVKDHLGNNHLVLDASQNIVQSNCYDPFGAWYDDGTNTGSVQPYKYNGKELDRTNGLDLYDYGARNYDAASTRWMTVDPLCSKNYNISPYTFCIDNPIRYADVLGLDSIQYNQTELWHNFNTLKDFVNLHEVVVVGHRIGNYISFGNGVNQSMPDLSLSSNLSILNLGINNARSNMIDEKYNLWRGKTGKWYSRSRHPNGITGSYKAVQRSYKSLGVASKFISYAALFNSAIALYESSTNGDTYGSIINSIDCIIPMVGILGGQYANPLFDAAVFGWTAGEIHDDWSEKKEGEQ